MAFYQDFRIAVRKVPKVDNNLLFCYFNTRINKDHKTLMVSGKNGVRKMNNSALLWIRTAHLQRLFLLKNEPIILFGITQCPNMDTLSITSFSVSEILWINIMSETYKVLNDVMDHLFVRALKDTHFLIGQRYINLMSLRKHCYFRWIYKWLSRITNSRPTRNTLRTIPTTLNVLLWERETSGLIWRKWSWNK